ncbi:MAG: hypothetical protein KDB22_09215 [Planctomycetales bacterium]|nr:hypothetical protein [Planctomycetales bacterium]
MPKALCLIGLVLAILVFLIFVLDLVLAMTTDGMAPFNGASTLMDVMFIISSAGIIWVAWSTFREQK